MKYDRIIGIDPGANGAIAVYDVGKQNIRVGKMPVTEKRHFNRKKGKWYHRRETDASALMAYLQEFSQGTQAIVFLEKVQAHRGDVDTPGKSYGIGKLLANYEQLKAVLKLSGLPFVEVYPVSWQSTLHLKKRDGETDTERKRRYKEYAQANFPMVEVTMWNSDALILCEFGFIKLKTAPEWVWERLQGVENNPGLL